MDKKDRALELAIRFSFITNRLKYCGPSDAYKDFFAVLEGKKYDREKIKDHFRRYEGLYVYLDHIAKKYDKDAFDYDVIESYWLGNSLLEKFTKTDLENMILALVNRGLPKKYAHRLIPKLPEGMNPHHSFNVLFVGVGMTTGSVPTNLITMNKCTVSVGRIIKVGKKLTVEIKPLAVKNNEIKYGTSEKKEIEFDKRFLNPKKGDKVAIHWDFACKTLSQQEEKNIFKYTKENIDALNRIGFLSSD